MLRVKIELCLLGWYSSSSTAIVLYNRMCICVKCFQAIAKSSKKSDLHKISSASLKAVFVKLWVATPIGLPEYFVGSLYYWNSAL